jgi:PIN domain nuclease of toxin-antitoxin system
MRVLLDTHTLVWAVRKPTKLGPRIRRVLDDSSVGVVISDATIWELSIKVHLGKLPEAEPILAGLEVVYRELRAEALPIVTAHATLAGSLTWHHKDPFDRMLAAQALVEGLSMASADEVFDSIPTLQRVW